MLHFRPLPVLTAVCAVLFAILIGLGVWQIERLHWKLGLIAQVTNRLSLPPLPLDRALALGEAAQYRRVALTGRFENEKESYVYGTGPDGGPVYHVLTPFVTGDGRTLIVDRGIVPGELRDPSTRLSGRLMDERRVVGVWRTPDGRGPFTPAPDAAHRIFYSVDVAGIAAATGVKLAAPVVVEADATPNPGGWPKGGQTKVAFRNEHLQYAITWFALAATLLGIYVAFHISRGRLKWTTR